MNHTANVNQIAISAVDHLKSYERLSNLWQNKELYIFTHGQEAFERAKLECFANHQNPERFINVFQSYIKYK